MTDTGTGRQAAGTPVQATGKAIGAGLLSTLARSTVSHHLKILQEAGVLGSEKVGKEVHFWIDRAALDEALSNVLAYVRDNT